MAKDFRHIAAALQPDRTSCWSTTMSWWSKAVKSVPNYREIDVLGMYSQHIGPDGGIYFPGGFKKMLQDPVWGLKVEELSWDLGGMQGTTFKSYFDIAPVICGYWDYEVGGHHAVAVYNYNFSKKEGTTYVWAMDPRLGMHIKREVTYYQRGWSDPKDRVIIGYLGAASN